MHISDTIISALHKYNTRIDFVFVSIFTLYKRKIRCIDKTSKLINTLISRQLIDKQEN
jgi:hypothetical protein